MKRDDMLARLREERSTWDVVVIGGGATGLGCAVDAASRGLRTALVEAKDFAHATSSRSTKLAHGGVRYLRAGQIGLVAQSLRERNRLARNAPGLVHDLAFLVPAYRAGERAYYGAGLFLYSLMARGERPTRIMSAGDVADRLPALRRRGLRGGVLYHDGQFDDARLALALARTAAGLGAVVANYVRVERLIRRDGRVGGVVAIDVETGDSVEIPARAVVNAAGVFADSIRRMDDPGARPVLRASRGAHIVLDGARMPGSTAVLLPHTDDGRVLFLIPWRGRVLVGTTDTPVDNVFDEPVPTRDDVRYLLDHASRYLEQPVSTSDVRGAFAGLRPLLAGAGPTAALRRDHRVMVSPGGLVTVAGGKWTTYRHMAEDAIDRARALARFVCPGSRTSDLRLDASADAGPDPIETFACGPGHGMTAAESAAIGAFARTAGVRDMARCVEDVMARRSRALFLDARAARAAAAPVAGALAGVLGRDDAWVRRQVIGFEETARRYLPPDADGQ